MLQEKKVNICKSMSITSPLKKKEDTELGKKFSLWWSPIYPFFKNLIDMLEHRKATIDGIFFSLKYKISCILLLYSSYNLQSTDIWFVRLSKKRWEFSVMSKKLLYFVVGSCILRVVLRVIVLYCTQYMIFIHIL